MAVPSADTLEYRIYASEDDELDLGLNGDAQLGGTFDVEFDGDSEDLQVSIQLPDPVNSGSYLIGAFLDLDDKLLESNESNNGRAAFIPLSISGGELAIVTSRLPTALLQERYTALLAAVGGDGDYLWGLAAGSDPSEPLTVCWSPRPTASAAWPPGCWCSKFCNPTNRCARIRALPGSATNSCRPATAAAAPPPASTAAPSAACFWRWSGWPRCAAAATPERIRMTGGAPIGAPP